MHLTRRTLLSGLAAAVALGGAGSALALTEDDARAHVSATVDDLLKVLRSANGAPVGVPELREIMVRRANLPLIARFCAGRSWRDMNEAIATIATSTSRAATYAIQRLWGTEAFCRSFLRSSNMRDVTCLRTGAAGLDQG